MTACAAWQRTLHRSMDGRLDGCLLIWQPTIVCQGCAFWGTSVCFAHDHRDIYVRYSMPPAAMLSVSTNQ